MHGEKLRKFQMTTGKKQKRDMGDVKRVILDRASF
jgi:hypothetical protein